MSTQKSAFTAAIGMLLISGLLCYVLASDTEQLNVAAARVAQVPMDVGEWHAQEQPADEAAFAQTGAKGYWVRKYVHERTKVALYVILMCGRAGKMGVHTPEVCYGGAGYEMRDQPVARTIEETNRFWTAQFTKKSSHLRLCWAWNSRGDWEASSSPRWEFRGELFLYKLYVSHETNGKSTPDDSTADFLRAFVPEARQALFPQ
jgi:hypothetical protein